MTEETIVALTFILTFDAVFAYAVRCWFRWVMKEVGR